MNARRTSRTIVLSDRLFEDERAPTDGFCAAASVGVPPDVCAWAEFAQIAMTTDVIAPIILLAPFVFICAPLPVCPELPFEPRSASGAEAARAMPPRDGCTAVRTDYRLRRQDEQGVRGWAGRRRCIARAGRELPAAPFQTTLSCAYALARISLMIRTNSSAG
ncbi:hypothetical protein BN2475_150175 [Paraburkholderia ribeironis]|uniref:Uncharacterized protein n=1 Tax=Paraburkholderia ribeironis TaxID=1247936 RepID=A0A1N7RV49_9BURK|nr:hypothetical protein BN2475_150175 [Paraburkholderia ribeironis]